MMPCGVERRPQRARPQVDSVSNLNVSPEIDWLPQMHTENAKGEKVKMGLRPMFSRSHLSQMRAMRYARGASVMPISASRDLISTNEVWPKFRVASRSDSLC